MKKWWYCAFAFLVTQTAWSQEFKQGVEYERLTKPMAVQTGEQIEVRELFWYRCPHCFSLEPFIHDWLPSKPENADYVPFPAVLSQSWELQARAFFTFEALGVMDKLHTAFFVAIHEEKKNIRSPKDLAKWAATQGVDEQAVLDAYDSFAVDTKTRQAALLTREYGITGVPAIIIDGKYRTSGQMAGGNERLFAVIDHLVAKAAEERQ